MKHFLTLSDITSSKIIQLIERANEMKQTNFRSKLLAGKLFCLFFEKASTRTRISFEAAIRQLGGDVFFMSFSESQLGRGEPIKDTARVMSRYIEGLIVRTFSQNTLNELVEFGTIPVVNALSDLYHPCQIMADLLTIYERTPNIMNQKIAWVGDGNNMANSWIEAAILLRFELRIATPKGFEPNKKILTRALAMGAQIFITNDPKEAIEGADYINTDVWASMGQESEKEKRLELFMDFQLNETLLKYSPKAKILHCLPAHRGEEITDSVIEGNQSIIFDQAENRLHAQKSILEYLYS